MCRCLLNKAPWMWDLKVQNEGNRGIEENEKSREELVNIDPMSGISTKSQ